MNREEIGGGGGLLPLGSIFLFFWLAGGCVSAQEISFFFGFDDNPAQDTIRDEDSYFRESRFFLRHSFSSVLGVDFWGNFRDYDTVPDLFSGGLEFYRKFGTDSLSAEVSLGIQVYRDGITPEDEFNAATIFLALDKALSQGRFFSLWFDYQERFFLHFESKRAFWRRYHWRGIKGLKAGPPTESDFEKFSRRDHFWHLQAQLTKDIYPFVFAISLFYERNDSNFALEDYRGPGFQGQILFFPFARTRIEFLGTWQRLAYAKAPHHEKRRDSFREYRFLFSYDLGRFRLEAELLHETNQSVFEFEDYRRSLVRCGFSFSF